MAYNIGKFSKAKAAGATKANAKKYAKGEISLEAAVSDKGARKASKKRAKKASKKTGKKRNRLTASQRAAGAAAHRKPAAVRHGYVTGAELDARKTAKRRGKKSGKKRAPRKIGKAVSAGAGLAYLAADHKRVIDKAIRLESENAALQSQLARQAGAAKPARRRRLKPRGSKRAIDKSMSRGQVVTLDRIKQAAKHTGRQLWICTGRTRTGCGGGKAVRAGSRVAGVWL